MKVNHLHNWQITPKQARTVQNELSGMVSRNGNVEAPHLIAGVDISCSRFRNTARAAVVLLDYPALNPVDFAISEKPIGFPYIPGLLSFREAPLILDACEKLHLTPDILLVDGQGIAHPLRIGLASHLGLFLNIPTIGCAKSRLCGEHEVVPDETGTYVELKDKEEVIGAVLRTKIHTKPIYVSIGHLINLTSAVNLVVACCRGYRLPEPTRLAHQVAGGRVNL